MTLTGKDRGVLDDNRSVALVVRRIINAPAKRLFAAWTEPAELVQWWGPADVTCSDAEIDLAVGGRYRIANRFPDGNIIWIHGVFEQIEPPGKLVYSWQLEGQAAERVTIRFVARAAAVTEVVITHERITDQVIRERHERGWNGCLDGLKAFLEPG